MRKMIIGLFFAIGFALPAQAQDGGLENLRQTGKAFAQVARKVSPSVVFIQTEGQAKGSSITRFSAPFDEQWPFGDDLFKRFFGDQLPGIPRMPKQEVPKGERRAIGQGSGFVFAAKDGLLSDKTYILTNNHVVEDAEKIRVQFQDGREYDAGVTGRDPQSDVAVLAIEASGLSSLRWGDSSGLEVGEWVVAIAKQLIEHGEVTRGYLGVVIQQLTPDLAESFDIDSTKSILVAQVSEDSPADKAGLRQGDVIVEYRDEPVTDVGSFRNRVSLTAPGSTEGITVLRNGKRTILQVRIGQLTEDKLIAQGPAQSADEIGLTVQTLTPQHAEQFNAEAGEGVVVTNVRPGSVAAMAGIEPGAIILQANQQPVKDAAAFAAALQRSKQENRVLLLIRDGGMQQFVALSW